MLAAFFAVVFGTAKADWLSLIVVNVAQVLIVIVPAYFTYKVTMRRLSEKLDTIERKANGTVSALAGAVVEHRDALRNAGVAPPPLPPAMSPEVVEPPALLPRKRRGH